jgi:hypothetical protein
LEKALRNVQSYFAKGAIKLATQRAIEWQYELTHVIKGFKFITLWVDDDVERSEDHRWKHGDNIQPLENTWKWKGMGHKGDNVI